MADLGENLISAAPECQSRRLSGCSRGGSHAVKVSFGVLATWEFCTGFRFLFGVRFGKFIRFLRVSDEVRKRGRDLVRYSLAFDISLYAANIFG